MTDPNDQDPRPVTAKGEGHSIEFSVYRELWREINQFVLDVNDRARNDADSGRAPLIEGETRGKTWSLGPILAWFVGLSEDDRLRVHREGRELMLACRAQGRGYRGGLPFARRAGSVFADDSAAATVAPRASISPGGPGVAPVGGSVAGVGDGTGNAIGEDLPGKKKSVRKDLRRPAKH